MFVCDIVSNILLIFDGFCTKWLGFFKSFLVISIRSFFTLSYVWLSRPSELKLLFICLTKVYKSIILPNHVKTKHLIYKNTFLDFDFDCAYTSSLSSESFFFCLRFLTIGSSSESSKSKAAFFFGFGAAFFFGLGSSSSSLSKLSLDLGLEAAFFFGFGSSLAVFLGAAFFLGSGLLSILPSLSLSLS